MAAPPPFAAAGQRAPRGLWLIRARLVVPMASPPIENGAVVVTRGSLEAVGRWSMLSRGFAGSVVDLGEVALLPGLINAHCHLDYTDMRGLFPPPRRFTDWIKQINTEKSAWALDEFARSWRHGAEMLVRHGTTTVGDVEAVPELLPQLWNQTPLRVLSFLEMIGIRRRREPQAILAETLARIRRLRHPRCRAWLSPHAPYTTQPALLRAAASLTRRHHWPMTIHVAESDLEYQMFARARGELHRWLHRNERDNSDCGLGSPVAHLERCGALSPELLAIHVNYLARNDDALLARRQVTVVHCPRSHSYFGHRKFPYRQLALAGARMCLATDSLASTRQTRRQPAELNLFDELREFAGEHPEVPSETLFRMITVNPARALRLTGKAGLLAPGSFADLIAVPHRGASRSLFADLLQHRGPVAASLIAGRWAVPPSTPN